MRLPVGLCLLAASATFAAPQKEKLSPGAVGRLGTPITPGKAERPGEINALLFVGENTLFVGTGVGWNTWDLQKRQPRQARPVGGPVFAVARDHGHILVGSARKLQAIEPVESAMAEPARSWDAATDGVSVLAVAPTGNRVVYADGDQKLTVIELKSGDTTGTVQLPARPVAAALTANGRVLAVVTQGGAARVYHLAATGAVEPAWLKRVARSDRTALQFSPDGRLLAVSSAGRILVLDAVTGRPMVSVDRKFGEGDVRCLAFSPDGRRLVAGSGGGEPVVRVWATETGEELATYTGHRGDVNAVAFDPDGKTAASGGADQAVYLWHAPPAPPSAKPMAISDAWESLDSLEAGVAYRALGTLMSDPKGTVPIIRDGFRGTAADQSKIRRWVTELDHDEFRIREAARRALTKAGLRAAAVIKDPARKKLGAEGEERVRLILADFDERGLRVPEGGLNGEPLRMVRAVRVLESIGGSEAKRVLEEMAKGPADQRVANEARAALEVYPATR